MNEYITDDGCDGFLFSRSFILLSLSDVVVVVFALLKDYLSRRATLSNEGDRIITILESFAFHVVAVVYCRSTH